MSHGPAVKTPTQAQVLPPLGIAAVLATVSTFVWLEITRVVGHLQMDISMLFPFMWLGFLFVLWPASTYFSRLLGSRDTSSAAIAFLPVGCVLLMSGLMLNYAQYRQRSLNNTRQGTEEQAAKASVVANDRGYEQTLHEIASGGSLSVYKDLIHSDGTVPQGIQHALGEIAASGTGSQRHELTTSYLSDYVLMKAIACHKDASAEDLRLIFDYYNNSYAYNPKAANGQQHWWVLSCLAQNSRTPVDLLSGMLATSDVDNVMKNPSLPRPVLIQFLERESRGEIGSRLHAAACRYSTPDILERLASDPEPYGRVRMEVAKNPATPDRVIERMLGDQDFRLVEVARGRLVQQLGAGDTTLAHRLVVSHSSDYQLMIAIACQKDTTSADLRLIFQHFSDHPTYSWVHDSLVKCLNNHPDAPREALLSLHH